jgi:hypothetical protein
VLDRLHGPRPAALAVTDPDGILVGLLTRQNLAEMMIIKSMRPGFIATNMARPAESCAGASRQRGNLNNKGVIREMSV